MQKIIDGKRYNTETAHIVGYTTNGYEPDNFNYIERALFRKNTGEYFLYTYGGANTEYSQRVGLQSWQGGEVIEPIDYNEAVKFAEKNLTVEEYEEEFGLPDEETEDQFIALHISAQAKAKIDRERSKTGKTIREVIEDLADKL